MKKVTLLMAFALIGCVSYAQKLEFKLRPISAIISKKYQIGLEYGVSKHFGIELEPRGSSNAKRQFLNVEYKDNALGANLFAKYYFAPNRGFDRFNAGLYLNGEQGEMKTTVSTAAVKGIRHSNFAVGAVIGYKWLILEDITIETTLGLGRAFIRKYENTSNAADNIDLSKEKYLNLDGILRLSVGYRLGGGSLE